MASTPALRSAIASPVGGLREAMQRVAFVSAIGLSAFLLFSFELLAGRRVLPVFGGAPAVWTTVLCFFTGVLFLGYLYAHVVAARVPPRVGGVMQLGVAAVAIAVAVLTPAHLGSLRWDEMPAVLNVLVVLAIVAGGPGLLLAATTPLLSSWYAGRGRDPWWLFAVSNGASFVALLAYPLLIEPSIGLSAQRTLFSCGLALYAGSLLPIIYGARPVAADARARDERTPALEARRQTVWLLAALVPAGLLSATTNFLQTDLISAPLIWIGPLAIYLASFVVAFADSGRPITRICNWLAPAAATLLWVPFVKLHEGWPPIPLFAIELGALFVLAVAIHGKLAADRPETGHLTRFYLVVTAGGALGTAFVAIVAPLIFSTIYEYPLLIAAGLAVLALLPDGGAVSKSGGARLRVESVAALRRVLPYAAVAGGLYFLIRHQEPTTAANVRNVLLLGGVVVVTAITPRTLAIVAPIVLGFLIAVNAGSPLVRSRTFFGVIEVRQGNGIHLEYSGTTLHGQQFTDARGAEPSAYYSRVGPLGAVFEDLRSRTDGARIGVVGLGVGTVAAYALPGDEMTFYEINPAVVDIARDPRYFTYLANAAVTPHIVVGDARLSLDDQPAGSYDLLILDAFSSDTVPAHLLTREAIEGYVRTLRPGGVLAFHLSNRYYDLIPPVIATVRAAGLDGAYSSTLPATAAAEFGAIPSLWLVVAPEAGLAPFVAEGWDRAPEGGYVLTDDYSDLTRSLDLSGF